ncbi:MAG: 4Fe-4S binding protein [Syntrophaceae bacterium]|nr:4Fe-4S binding protein [Syntrophaceae bacterium]
MSVITLDEPGKELLLMGNEAIARGALEAGVKVGAAYPGTPSTDIIENLAGVASQMGLYVEWSINEKVALEVASAASFSGLRAICAMKQNGMNVASDYLMTLNLVGVKTGLVLVACDDPQGHSSNNEQDSRLFAKMADLPLLEPATFQESKEMTKWAFELSEEIGNVVILRGVTRTSHARGNVVLGKLPRTEVKPRFDRSKQWLTQPLVPKHQQLHRTLDRLEEIYGGSPFNQYLGPESPRVLLITSGTGWLYSQEAVEILGLEDSVGILKVGTTWPLPTRWIVENLKRTDRVLFIEEVESFLEGNVKEIAADHSRKTGPKEFFGKKSGHIPPMGEMTPDRVVDALARILGVSYQVRTPEYEARAQEVAKALLPSRALGFCAGCAHRASFWSIKNALQLDNREGFATYDIGCYALARGPAGYYQLRVGGAMGTGTGLASGFGRLSALGFDQPVIAMCGDSTFFHSAMPALVNAHYNKSNLVMIILDNSATAMTGFQPHPGVGKNAMGEVVSPVSIEGVCRAFGAKVEATDPFDLPGTRDKILRALEDPEGAKVLIMRRRCQMLKGKDEKPPYRVWVDPRKCIGEDCGCDRVCTRVFKCPGLIWDAKEGKSKVDEVICIGCGVCADICPEGAILKEETK